MTARVWWNEERGTWWLIDEVEGKPRKVKSYHPRRYRRGGGDGSGGDDDAREAARAAAQRVADAINAELAAREERARAIRGALAAGQPILADVAIRAWLDSASRAFGQKHARSTAQMARDYLLPYFTENALDLRRLRVEDVAAFATWMVGNRRRGEGPLSESSIRYAVSAFRRTLNWLEEDPELEFRARVKGLMDRALEAARSADAWTGSRDSWSREEGARLLEIAQRSELGPIVMAALHTGARKAELLGLDWKDVNLEDGSFRVTQTLTEKNKIKRSGKTKRSERRVKMSPALTAVLRAMARERFSRAGLTGEPPGRVFRHRSWEPWTYHGLDSSWDQARARAHGQYGVRPFEWHSFRHTYVSWALADGQRPTAVAKQIGTSLATLHKHYSHLLKDDEVDPSFLSDSRSGAPSLPLRVRAAGEGGAA